MMPNEKITLKQLIDHCFDTTKTTIKQQIVFGAGKIENKNFNIVGTVEDTSFGVDESIEMARCILDIIKNNNTDPIVLLTDVAGQKLSVRDEWLGMYAYFAHLLKCLHLARQNGNKIITLIYNQAIGGSFIAFGMMADRIYALKNAKLAVMWLEGMSKVTKIDIDVLRKISETSPVFAPGVENFKKLGGLHQVVDLDEVTQQLLLTLKEPNISHDNRAKLGKQYGGRKEAYDIIKAIENL
ncbi:TPA: biotin-independent malonate decarboxylase subunit gamma [Legionella pneumophila]|uniref:biotin-independent malonate decarboxylase subunit gamma n=1 Tax=Legionella sp. PATHC039 TaxID=2992042 RepID=UPI0007785C3A|nr:MULTISPECIES: biotin-independent malonate decarboxylase subunit gamma [Legionella]HAT8858246.1 biotin-independent malonate decarboxylase subunit gamma [Legionella pneumophila subsp. pneumophila]MCW8396946.1 biotin-independent malonate decarboxylase subunit gamma [Legionella sp. PATHC039]HAT7072715.1 biotin-independent malonate decarboxylase subunit gamma [Legionella pneumophila]HAT8640787.1 biotin-independent malonate decarboxylase subunit gamma [Legionella pneumophila]HAT8867573.1 biotin-i